MRRRRQVAAALVVASTGLVSAGVAPPAVADSAATLYVDGKGNGCSDSGPGSQAQPFCTIQAGADAAQPGQTVLVTLGTYPEQVTVHHSGTPDKPITIRAAGQVRSSVGVQPVDAQPATAHAFVLDHVHDVTVQHFGVATSSAEAFLVKDSSGITLDGNEVIRAGFGSYSSPTHPPAVPSGSPAVRVTGASSGVVLSRNLVGGGYGGGIVVDPGVSGTVISTNAVTHAAHLAGISVTDAPQTVITSNTVISNGDAGIALAGNSDHAVLENNVVGYSDRYAAQAVELSVSAGSVPGTKADYNLLGPSGPGTAYRWAGTSYQQPADFMAATGQGAHDLREKLDTPLGEAAKCVNCSVQPTAAFGATDSADASAPGELTTDVYGHRRVDAPVRDNSGTGVGYYDRGAAELEEYADRVNLDASPAVGPYPLPVTVTAKATQYWPGATTYTYDFGDGSDPLVTTDAEVQHVYRSKGTYGVSVTVHGTDPANTASGKLWSSVVVDEPGDIRPDVRLVPAPGTSNGPLSYSVDISHTVSPWPIKSTVYDFGDGTPSGGGYVHTYSHPGDYTVTATMTDTIGRTATARTQVHAAYGPLGFTPVMPTRLYDTRTPDYYGIHHLGPGQSIDVYIPSAPGHPYPAAAVLNVTAVSPSQGGYLSVYPAGSPRPSTSNVNFTAGQTVPNLVTVPVGESDRVTVYNFSGTTDVVVDLMGVYESGGGARFTALAPSRLLDTRQSTAVGPDASTSVQVRGVGGVPADATSVVLNVTSTGSDAGGYLTAYASGTERPGTSNLNFTAGQTVANQVVVPIGADGKVSVYNKFGHTHVVADVFGYYGPSGASLFTPVSPTRLVDTRTPGRHALGQGGTLPVASGAPVGATGAVLNVTSTASTAGGYLTVWADGAAKPGTSNLNFLAGKTVPNHVTTPLGANGSFDVYNFLGQTQVVADLFGYFTK
ncbi:PKD domain-containing protein [Kitasatospora sp. McL0602]|uniref:PKD domain-containing protein n=1 Tax=Kitasatospora sp. McL0602 TaxID=3439530 RepID=UPI003F8A4EC7